jgi:microcystin-dependent protein
MGAQFTIPLITVIPGQLIASALWNNEFQNLNTNLIPAGLDSYSDTDGQMQLQTAPFPGSVTSHASNLGGEIERIRYQLAAILGTTYWYNAPSSSIATAVNSLVPIGGCIDYPSATAPNANYHLADGTAINRTTYAALFALISTTFGAGDGSTTFNLPNYTDRVSIAAGNLYALAATGGEASHTLLTSEIPSVTVTDPGHIHAVTDPGHIHSIKANGSGSGYPAITSADGSGLGFNSNSATTGVSVNSHTTGITVAGGGGAHNNLQPYLSMYKMIRVL